MENVEGVMHLVIKGIIITNLWIARKCRNGSQEFLSPFLHLCLRIFGCVAANRANNAIRAATADDVVRNPDAVDALFLLNSAGADNVRE